MRIYSSLDPFTCLLDWPYWSLIIKILTFNFPKIIGTASLSAVLSLFFQNQMSRFGVESWFWGSECAPVVSCRLGTGLASLACPRSLSWKQWIKDELRDETKGLELETTLIIKKACKAEAETIPEILCRRRKSLMKQNTSWAGIPLKGTAYVARCESFSGLSKERRIFVLLWSTHWSGRLSAFCGYVLTLYWNEHYFKKLSHRMVIKLILKIDTLKVCSKGFLRNVTKEVFCGQILSLRHTLHLSSFGDFFTY